MTLTELWQQRGAASIIPTYARYPLVAAKGQGCWLWDVEGRRYLDFLAGVAVNNLGHCHPKVVQAVQEQAASLIHCSNFYHIPQQIELAEWLTQRSFAHQAFFCNSGAEANEAAVKLARKHQAQRFGEQCFEIITALASFHGRTIGTLSATGQSSIQKGFAPLVPGFKYVPFGDAEALKNAINPNTCAVLLEPIQGEGGIHTPPPGYLQAVRQICDEQQLLLIYDEVQCGCGRSGSLFAYTQEEAPPHLLTLAKGLAGGVPIGALLATEEIAASFGPGSHGSTFGGNPLATQAALAALQALEDEGLMDNARHQGAYLRQCLEQLVTANPLAQSVRGRGLMLGLELSIDGKPLVAQALEKGLLLNCTAGNVIRFVPPLIVSRQEIDQALAIFTELLDQAAAAGKESCHET